MPSDQPRTPHVVIDGVLYVPATTAVANLDVVLRTLALQWHTPETFAEAGFSDGTPLRIVVTDDRDDGETFDEFAARLADDFGRTP